MERLFYGFGWVSWPEKTVERQVKEDTAEDSCPEVEGEAVGVAL